MNTKENINSNKFEAPMLKMEPVKMKKKKKGGGYNLRKSLAWNRAFFTEEGVLDPEELSMISGTVISPPREGLSTVNEDSLAEDFQFNNDYDNLQAPEKNLFKGAPASSSNKDGEAVHLPPKHSSPACFNEASVSMTSHQVLSTHGTRKVGSTGGASPTPRPSPSPSLKRPGRTNACKPVSEVSKFSRIPVSKPTHSSLPATSKSGICGMASSNQNQTILTVVKKQRQMEPKSYSNSGIIPKNRAKAAYVPLPIKSPALQAKRNKVNPPLNINAPTKLCSPQVSKVGNCCPKVVPDDGPPTIKMDTFDDQHVSVQVGDSLPLKNVIAGGTLQNTKAQSDKPSGLRTPSPSLGFFGQSKPSASNSFLHRIVDSMPRVEKLNDGRPQQLPAKVTQVVHSKMLSATSAVSKSRCDLNSVSNISITPDVQGDSKKHEKVPHDCKHHGIETDDLLMMNVRRAEENFQHHVKNKISIALEEDKGAELNERKLFLGTEPCVQLREDGDADNCNLGHSGKGTKFLSQQNFVSSATSITGTRTTANIEVLNSAIVSSNLVSCSLDLHQSSRLLTDDLENFSREELSVSDVDKTSVVEGGSSKILVRYSQSSTSGKIGDEDFENVELTNFELADPSFLLTGQSEDSVRRDVITSLMPETLLLPDVSNKTGNLSGSSGMTLKPQTTCLEVGQISIIINGLPSADSFSIDEDIDSEEPQKNVNEKSSSVFSANGCNLSQIGDDSDLLAVGNVPVSSISHTSVTCNLYAEGANCSVEPEQPELLRCSILVREFPEDANEVLATNCLHEETVKAENFEKSRAHAFPVKGECETDSNISRAISFAPLEQIPAQANGDYRNENNDGSCAEEITSSCMEIQPSFEKTELSSKSQLRHDVEFGGLEVQGDLTSPRRIDQSVGSKNGALTDETQNENFQNVNCIVRDMKCNLVTSCKGKDEIATADIKKSARTSNETNSTILPPRNAVPFSDEWLAAVEAAGEEILTMKSGAVQNSPPDKTLPEPNPWSPVKKKNNAIGPYDCTKCTNN